MSKFSYASLSRPSRQKSSQRQTWDPPALRWWNLGLLTLICWTFIALLLYFLNKSQQDGGIIFAPNVNELPLRRSFVYLYLPTVVAVVFSIYLAWIDLDAKRFEPYHQLSKVGGALGKDSLLLHYPNEFIPIVPFFALKRRHWLVFWASTATVLTTFGIVPLQAGIFSTERVTRSIPQIFGFWETTQPGAELSASYAQSAYGILKLNETVPRFMTRNYTLAPFDAADINAPVNSTLTVNTTLYGLDLQCESALIWTDEFGFPAYNSSAGCAYQPMYGFGNETVGTKPQIPRYAPDLKTKGYSALYQASYEGGMTLGGMENLGIHSGCEQEVQKGTFVTALVQNRAKEEDPANKPTVLFCTPNYFEQAVLATVDADSKAPIAINYVQAKRPMSPGVFNTSIFHAILDGGTLRQGRQRQNTLPVTEIPTYRDQLSDADLSLVMIVHETVEPDLLHPMAAMALTSQNRDMKENLDPTLLAESYEKAWRLLFARAMVDVLKVDSEPATKKVEGEQTIVSEAVVLEPVFTYLVVGFLGAVSVSALALLYMTIARHRKWTLVSDPGTIAATMSLVADNEPLLSSFANIDGASTKHLQQRIKNRRYRLDPDTRRFVEIISPADTQESLDPAEMEIAKPVKPVEFRLVTAIPFTGLFVALAIVGAVLFNKSRPHGLSLPSKNRFVQNLVREYVPTVLATAIEPMWILVNRLLCMLQPLQELQGSRAPASKSITLNYSSLPPQLTLFKAIRAGHIVLAAVCAMALLANLLATAFAGLLFQDTVALSIATPFAPPFVAKFVAINGASGPTLEVADSDNSKANYSGAYQGGSGEGQFLIAESNLTYGTPLASWTDEHAMYLPFLGPSFVPRSGADIYRGRSKFFSAELNCKSADIPLLLSNETGMSPPEGAEEFEPYSIKIEDGKGISASCYSSADVVVGSRFSMLNPTSTLWNSNGQDSGKVAGEVVTTMHAGINATEAQDELCRSTVAIGWIRTPERGTVNATSENSLFLTCRPRLVFGDATVVVGSDGRLKEKVSDRAPDSDQSPESLDKYLTNGEFNVIGQSNLFIFHTLMSSLHNDTFGSEYIHYFVNQVANSTIFTDPQQPPPKYSDVIEPLQKAYSLLFSQWVGLNKDLLLARAGGNGAEQPSVLGEVIYMEERLFFKTALFIISEVILGIYIVTSVFVYLRRPGQYLPRLPTSIGAIIALFAASAAVEDLRGTSQFTARKREEFLEESGFRYGYGSYVGGDGSVHVGIEKAPFVRTMAKTTFEHSRFDKERKKTASVQVVSVPGDAGLKKSP